jgi:hypothetical protein
MYTISDIAPSDAEDDSSAANGFALRTADRQGDHCLRRQLAEVQQMVS